MSIRGLVLSIVLFSLERKLNYYIIIAEIIRKGPSGRNAFVGECVSVDAADEAHPIGIAIHYSLHECDKGDHRFGFGFGSAAAQIDPQRKSKT
jgi:hypothetical protein